MQNQGASHKRSSDWRNFFEKIPLILPPLPFWDADIVRHCNSATIDYYGHRMLKDIMMKLWNDYIVLVFTNIDRFNQWQPGNRRWWPPPKLICRKNPED